MKEKMNQLTLYNFLDGELICCSLSEGYHWLRITSGHTPSEYEDFVHFKLDGYDHIYENTAVKDEIISVFGGMVKVVPYEAAG